MTRSEVVGEGANACVFRPQLPCDDDDGGVIRSKTSRSKTVGKIIKLNVLGIADNEANSARLAASLEGVHAPAYLARCAVQRSKAAACRGFLHGLIPLGFSGFTRSSDTVEQVVMENVEGGTLESMLMRPTPSWRLDASVFHDFVDVLRAVDALERAGYAHLDIHAGNIMVTPKGMRLIDYGWLRPVSTVWTSSSLLRAFYIALTHAPLPSPHNERSELAHRARASYETYQNTGVVIKGRFGLMASEAAGVDALATGAILWRMLCMHPSYANTTNLIVATGLTNPDASRRMTAGEAVALLS